MKYTTAQKRAQHYLRTVRLNERRIQTLEAEIELQQSRLQLNGVAFGENVNQSLAGDSFEQGFTALYERCDELDTELIGYTEEREEALSSLNKLENAQYYELLYLRYFRGLTFDQISRIMHISDRHIRRIHPHALSAFYHCLPNQYK